MYQANNLCCHKRSSRNNYNVNESGSLGWLIHSWGLMKITSFTIKWKKNLVLFTKPGLRVIFHLVDPVTTDTCPVTLNSNVSWDFKHVKLTLKSTPKAFHFHFPPFSLLNTLSLSLSFNSKLNQDIYLNNVFSDYTHPRRQSIFHLFAHSKGMSTSSIIAVKCVN